MKNLFIFLLIAEEKLDLSMLHFTQRAQKKVQSIAKNNLVVFAYLSLRSLGKPSLGILFFPISIILLVSCQQSSTTIQETPKTVIKASPTEEVEQTKVVKKAEPLDYYSTEWTELITLDSTIILDLRYATENNFVKEQMYTCGRCFLRPRVARRVYRAHQMLQKKGLGLKMFDCYRPRPIQQKLWDKVPNANYVTPPSKGSMHNKGAAVDLTIVNTDGDELYMGTEFDYFGKEGHHTFQDLPKEVLANRKLLKSTMEEVGLAAIRTEWWHYSFKGQAYDISDWVWKCK